MQDAGRRDPRGAAGARAVDRRARSSRRIRALVPLVGPVLLGSLIDVRERTFALEARGFGARPGPDRLPRRRRPAGRPLAAAAHPGSAAVAVVAGRARGHPRDRDGRRGATPTGAPLLIDGLGVRYPGRREPEPRRASTSPSRRGERRRASPAGPAPASRPWRWPRPGSSRASSGPSSTGRRRHRRPRHGDRGAGGALLGPGRDRLLDAGQPALGVEADRPRGARLRAREPRHAAGRDGRADRRDPGAPGDRPPRRPRAVRAVGRRAAAGGDRQHRGDGHRRPRPRRADRPSSTRPGPPSVADLLDELAADRHGDPVRRARPGRPRRGWTAASCSSAGGPSRSTSRARRSVGAWPASVGLPAPTLVRLAEAAGSIRRAAFDEAAVAAGSRAATPATVAARPGADRRRAASEPVWRPDGRHAAARPRSTVDGLVHRYPSGIEAVRGVSLTIEPGESVAILGPERLGQDDAREAPQRPPPPGRGRGRRSTGSRPTASSIAELAATVGFVFQNPDDQLFERIGRARGRVRAAQPRCAGRPRSPRASPPASTAVGLTGGALDQPVRPRPVAAQARRAGRRPGHGSRPSSSSTSRRPARTPTGVARVGAVVEAMARGRTDGRRDHPRHGVRGDALRSDRGHARWRGRRRRPAGARSSPPARPSSSRPTGLTPPPAARIAGPRDDGLRPSSACLPIADEPAGVAQSVPLIVPLRRRRGAGTTSRRRRSRR